MNTIYESTSNETQTVQNSSDNGSSLSTTTVTTTTSNGQQSVSNANGSSVTSVTSDTTSISSEEYCDNLKIISHLKNIEKINEKRRVFLTNTISEYSSDEKNGSETNTLNGHSTSSNGKVKDIVKTIDDNVHIEEKRFKRMHATAESFDSASEQELSFVSPPYTTPLKSPTSPPPKPPMLSRNRSIGNSGDRSSLKTPPQSPVFQASGFKTPADMELPLTPVFQGPLMSSVKTEKTSKLSEPEAAQTSAATTTQNSSAPVETAAVVTTSIVEEPVMATTIQLNETAVLRKVERPQSLVPAVPRQISENHYARLIEELKCPGCASPMKGPVLLCQSGHSICAQCTRVLLMCPLCKEPFTTLRSLTVEALCSKAHFRCSNAEGGCTVRLHLDLLGWHEKNCIYKPMKCFMGRIWGDCKWTGREINWKEHVETEHASKVFTEPSTDLMLVWNMGLKQKRLTAYYVFLAFDEMFNFYEINDSDRVLFTMTCTSTMRDKKDNFAFEVIIFHQDNEAISITQKFPVHSEYDKDILMDGTCVSIPLTDLAKFIDDEKLLHYRVRVMEVKSPCKSKSRTPNLTALPLDFQNTQIEGTNFKNVPSNVILTRNAEDERYTSSGEPETPSMEDEFEVMRRQYEHKFKSNDKNPSETESDPELEAFIRTKWGTPQLHFNRKYLGTNSSDTSSADDASNRTKNQNRLSTLDRKVKVNNDLDKASISSTVSTSYKNRMTNSLRKSFRALKSDIIDLKPFGKKSSPEKISAKQQQRASNAT